jgi:signal transduction histidine kinase
MNKSERDNKGRKQAHDGAVNATSVFPSEENAGDGADVERTISSIKKEKEEAANVSKKKNGFITAVKIIFFPVTGIVWCVRKMFRTINMPLTAKMTLIYSLIFAIVLAGFTVFFIASMDKTAGEEMKGYISTLIITASVLVVVVSVLYAAMVWITSQFMLKPIRTITESIDEVTGDNLSARLEQVDSQDELMELTNRINDMLNNLEQSFLRQQNFVADASHELKTPISVIQGYANMLRRWGKDDPKILDEGIEAIARDSENMKRIVEQLLLLARLGNFNLNSSRFNLSEVVEETVESYKMVDSAHEILCVCDENAITVETDKNLFTECLRAIIDNAIKYTPEGGGITVGCRMREKFAEITVADTGIGISAEDLPHIFERFYRCDKARGRAKGSTGLGLSIAKSIAETMGGEIEVSSNVGVGTTFTIKLY